MGALDGKVALITGAARGMGCSHAVRLAAEGADIIAVDLCDQPATVGIPGATPSDLDETVHQVEVLGQRIVSSITDVRDLPGLTKVVDDGAMSLERLDIVIANAGIWALALEEPRDLAARQQVWRETIDINLTGAWNTLEASAPILVAGGAGGAVVIISSIAGLKSTPVCTVADTAYTAAKHGLVGLMRSAALELAPHKIRVNTIHPNGVATPMLGNDLVATFFDQHPELAGGAMDPPLPVQSMEPTDISNAILFLVADTGRYVTGITLTVDAGFMLNRWRASDRSAFETATLVSPGGSSSCGSRCHGAR